MIHIYILNYCPYCIEAVNVLKTYKLAHKVYDVTDNKDIYKKKHKMNTFPQIFYIQNKQTKIIGGYDNLNHLIEITNNLKSNDISLSTLTYFYKKL
jgi:glutaredoxin